MISVRCYWESYVSLFSQTARSIRIILIGDCYEIFSWCVVKPDSWVYAWLFSDQVRFHEWMSWTTTESMDVLIWTSCDSKNHQIEIPAPLRTVDFHPKNESRRSGSKVYSFSLQVRQQVPQWFISYRAKIDTLGSISRRKRQHTRFIQYLAARLPSSEEHTIDFLLLRALNWTYWWFTYFTSEIPQTKLVRPAPKLRLSHRIAFLLSDSCSNGRLRRAGPRFTSNLKGLTPNANWIMTKISKQCIFIISKS